MTNKVDVLIIGAGAAGLGALDRLDGEPVEALLVEARDRVGGRAFTLNAPGSLPLDMGCGWLHSADQNPLVERIAQKGFVIDKTPPPWRRETGASEEERAEHEHFGRAFVELERRLEIAAREDVDRAGSDFLEPGGRWNGDLNAFSCYYNGVGWDQVSVLGYAAYEDSGVNWRVSEGYGAGIAALARTDRIRFHCPVAAIDHSGASIKMETAQGVLECRAAIVTAPTPHLARRLIRFHPDLPDKVEAAAGLPLGWAGKVFLSLLEPEALPIEGHFSGRDPARANSYMLRPLGRPFVEGYFAGAEARELELEGPGAMTAFALEQLADRFGSAVRSKLAALSETGWATDPFALGAYSYARPGFSGARLELSRPVEDRLFFAGEATHPHFFSTAHGAWESGVRAAEEALLALGL
jgi:monoamine oxidase